MDGKCIPTSFNFLNLLWTTFCREKDSNLTLPIKNENNPIKIKSKIVARINSEIKGELEGEDCTSTFTRDVYYISKWRRGREGRIGPTPW